MNSRWQQWRARQQSQLRVDITGAAVLAALTLAAYLAVIAPARQSSALADSNVARLSAERSKISQLSNTLTTLHMQKQVASQLTWGTLPQFHPLSDLNDRLAALSDLAVENNVQIDTMEPNGNPTVTSSFAITQVTLSGRGSYPNCAAFVESLHQKMRDMTVSSLSLSSPAIGDPAALSLQLRWYAAAKTEQGKR